MLWPRIQASWILYLVLISLGLAQSRGTALAAPPASEQAAPTPSLRSSEVIVHVPTDAIVWFDGVRTRQTGVERRFVTPRLAVGNRFRYDIRVSWMEGGRAVERQRRVSFRAGDRVVLDFAANARLNPPQDVLIDPAAPAPWRMNYYEDPFNWPDYPNRWRWYGHYPVSPINPR